MPTPITALLYTPQGWLRVVMGLVVLYLLFVGRTMLWEERLIFVPSRYPMGAWHPVGLPCEDVVFATADGVRLHGWHCPVLRPRCVFLMCHGNAGNITHRVDRIMAWQRTLNASVFVFDYGGYGRAPGNRMSQACTTTPGPRTSG
jgi:hypothetical protein